MEVTKPSTAFESKGPGQVHLPIFTDLFRLFPCCKLDCVQSDRALQFGLVFSADVGHVALERALQNTPESLKESRLIAALGEAHQACDRAELDTSVPRDLQRITSFALARLSVGSQCIAATISLAVSSAVYETRFQWQHQIARVKDIMSAWVHMTRELSSPGSLTMTPAWKQSLDRTQQLFHVILTGAASLTAGPSLVGRKLPHEKQRLHDIGRRADMTRWMLFLGRVWVDLLDKLDPKRDQWKRLFTDEVFEKSRTQLERSAVELERATQNVEDNWQLILEESDRFHAHELARLKQERWQSRIAPWAQRLPPQHALVPQQAESDPVSECAESYPIPQQAHPADFDGHVVRPRPSQDIDTKLDATSEPTSMVLSVPVHDADQSSALTTTTQTVQEPTQTLSSIAGTVQAAPGSLHQSPMVTYLQQQLMSLREQLQAQQRKAEDDQRLIHSLKATLMQQQAQAPTALRLDMAERNQSRWDAALLGALGFFDAEDGEEFVAPS